LQNIDKQVLTVAMLISINLGRDFSINFTLKLTDDEMKMFHNKSKFQFATPSLATSRFSTAKSTVNWATIYPASHWYDSISIRRSARVCHLSSMTIVTWTTKITFWATKSVRKRALMANRVRFWFDVSKKINKSIGIID